MLYVVVTLGYPPPDTTEDVAITEKLSEGIVIDKVMLKIPVPPEDELVTL